MPPGPPVLQTMVAEIYGPDAETRRQVALDLTKKFAAAESIVDVDNYLQKPHDVWTFVVDRKKAEHKNLKIEDVARQLSMIMGGFRIGDAKLGHELEPRNIVLQAPMGVRGDLSRLSETPIANAEGRLVPLSEVGSFQVRPEEPIIFHKDLRPLEYVTGEVAGRLAAPVYGMAQVSKLLKDYKTPDGVELSGTLIGPPSDSFTSGFEWTGEWTVTYETFRDMGLAFVAAVILIYMLVVLEFGNFRLPGIIMAPIPLTLIGIIPGHWLLGAEFTATSMIGWIALAGLIVRNSILLVDFSKHAIDQGMEVREAVIQAVRTRTRPILITQFAMMAGSSTILFDPIFQGMAISLLFGAAVSTALTLVVIPLACERTSRAAWASAEERAHLATLAERGLAPAPAAACGPAPAAVMASASASSAPAHADAHKDSLATRASAFAQRTAHAVETRIGPAVGRPLRTAGTIVGDGVGALLGRPQPSRPHSAGAQSSPVAAMPSAASTAPAALRLGWSVLRDGTGALLGRPVAAAPQTATTVTVYRPAPAVEVAPVAAPVTDEAAPQPAPAPAPMPARQSPAAVVPPPMADALGTTLTVPASTEARVSVADIAARAASLAITHAVKPAEAAPKPAAAPASAAVPAPAHVASTAPVPAPAKVPPPKQMAERRLSDPVLVEPLRHDGKLSAINGIGPSIAKMLHNLGVTSLHDIARWSADDLDTSEATRRFKGRIVRDDWIGQARRLTAQSGVARTETES